MLDAARDSPCTHRALGTFARSRNTYGDQKEQTTVLTAPLHFPPSQYRFPTQSHPSCVKHGPNRFTTPFSAAETNPTWRGHGATVISGLLVANRYRLA